MGGKSSESDGDLPGFGGHAEDEGSEPGADENTASEVGVEQPSEDDGSDSASPPARQPTPCESDDDAEGEQEVSLAVAPGGRELKRWGSNTLKRALPHDCSSTGASASSGVAHLLCAITFCGKSSQDFTVDFLWFLFLLHGRPPCM